MLTPIVTPIAPSITRVAAALRPFGLRNAGTPFEMDSTPVRAAHPDENARSSKKANAKPPSPSTKLSSSTIVRSAVAASGRSPPMYWTNPHRLMPKIATMNRYVGTANAVPDSRTPRRLTAISTSVAVTAIDTWWPSKAPMAVDAYCAAEEIDTATVST